MAERSRPAQKSAQKTAQQSAQGAGEQSAQQPAKKSAKQAAEPSRSRPMSAKGVAREAAEQLGELTGRNPEGVTAVERTEDGWRVQVQVTEVHRIPETTDVVALYDVDMDTHAHLQGYRRVRRYTRGEPGEE